MATKTEQQWVEYVYRSANGRRVIGRVIGYQGRWYGDKCPVSPWVCLSEGIPMLKTDQYKGKIFWDLLALVERCSDCMEADTIAAIRGVVARCEEQESHAGHPLPPETA